MGSLRKKEILEAQLSPIVPSFISAQISRLSKVLSEERLKPEFTIELKSLVHRKRAEQAAMLDESGVPTLYLPPPKPTVQSPSPPAIQPPNPSTAQSANPSKPQSTNVVGAQAPVGAKGQPPGEGWTFMSGQQQKGPLSFEEALFSILSSPTQNCLIRNERSLSVLTQDFVRTKFEEFANELELSFAPSPAPVPPSALPRSFSSSSEDPPARPPARATEWPKSDSRQAAPSMPMPISNPYAQPPKPAFPGPTQNPYLSSSGSFGNPYAQRSTGFSQPQNPYAAPPQLAPQLAVQAQAQAQAQGPYAQFPSKTFGHPGQNPYLANAGLGQFFEEPQSVPASSKRQRPANPGNPVNRAPKPPTYPPAYPPTYPPSFDPSPYLPYEEEEFFRGPYKQSQNPYSGFAAQPRKAPQEFAPRPQKTQRIQQSKPAPSRLEHPYPEDPEPEFSDPHRANPYLTGRVGPSNRNNFEDFDLDPRLAPAPSRQKRVFKPQPFHQ